MVKGTERTEPQYSEDDMYWLSLVEDVANGKMSDAGANQAWLEYINHKDEPTISKMEQVDEPQTERIKTDDYCDICNHKGCENCVADSLDDYCVPSGYEPITQTETQNSNLTFEKADEPQADCYKCADFWNCDGQCDEVEDEPQTDCAWK